jgi:hypothetical protein
MCHGAVQGGVASEHVLVVVAEVGVGVGVAHGTVACTGAIWAPVGDARLAQADPVVGVEGPGACKSCKSILV